jgi:(1->4)-alpha-D-glucan 1-alpha-D-glucosylmutase
VAPSSTYRLQFSKDTTFDDAVGLLPYLDALGIGALYASPLLESGAGSNHGYDVVDPTRVSAERGGEDGRRRLVDAVRAHGLGFVLDIVPNHVGVDVAKANPWWWDVLRLGRDSEHAATFDVDWAAGPILLPILGDDSLDDLSVDGDELRYHEHAFPIAPGTGDGTPQEVHERQHYRLVHWKRGAAELTYRRFFDVSTLAAVRVEIPEIFEKTHREVVRWVDAGDVDGIRVDHPDGLSDPGAYMRMLRAVLGPDRWLLVEKILGVGEELPPSWPVDGTSGYEALREIGGVFVDPDGAGLLTQVAAEHTGVKQSLHAAEHAARREVAATILSAEVRRIAGLVPAVDTAPAEAARPLRRRPTRPTSPTPPCPPRSRASRPPDPTGAWPRPSGCATPSPSCCAGSPCTAPTCPRGGPRWTPPCPSPAPTGRTSPTSSPRSTPRCSPSRAASWPPACSRPPAW